MSAAAAPSADDARFGYGFDSFSNAQSHQPNSRAQFHDTGSPMTERYTTNAGYAYPSLPQTAYTSELPYHRGSFLHAAAAAPPASSHSTYDPPLTDRPLDHDTEVGEELATSSRFHAEDAPVTEILLDQE